ncbi:MAG: FMN-binding protein [bacterium]|nr:FMN-binding protein [bacterium]
MSNKKRILNNALKLLHMISVISIVGGFLAMLVMLLGRDMTSFTGNEIIYDKMGLKLFNTTIIYGAILMVFTILGYSLFTEWGVIKYRFIIIKWALLIGVFCIAWFLVGSAVSGMASISDAGLHMSNMKTKYCDYYNRAVLSLTAELILLLITMFISIRKPFGKRDTKPFKYRKVAIAVVIPCAILGIAMMIFTEVRHVKLRNTPIKDVNLLQVKDGEYEGTSEFGNYTYHLRVTVKNHQIIDIENLKPRDSIYVTYATGVFKKIKDRQTPNVDAISGATTTSKAFMKAVENALEMDK